MAMVGQAAQPAMSSKPLMRERKQHGRTALDIGETAMVGPHSSGKRVQRSVAQAALGKQVFGVEVTTDPDTTDPPPPMDPLTDQADHEAPPSLPEPEDDPDLHECAARLQRLEEIQAQMHFDIAAHGDPLFPANYSSIARDGETCGDSAQGIENSCEEYNTWHTFQEYGCTDLTATGGSPWSDAARRNCGEYSRHGYCQEYGHSFGDRVGETEFSANDACCACGGGNRQHPFKILGPSGIQFHDIDQGHLATCYFLAALASIAYYHPVVLSNMFVDRGTWDENIYKTRWWINGRETIISVDNTIPGNQHEPWFTKWSRTGEWWPVILEKTWAKIFGSFKAVEYGWWSEAVAAMTRAPVYRFVHGSATPEDGALWNVLLTGTQARYPMCASTGGSGGNHSRYGLAENHMYSTLEATEQDGVKHVKVYNPWGADYYNGSLAHLNQSDGEFTMTLEEYHDAFTYTVYAEMMDDYQVSSHEVSYNDDIQDKMVTLEIETTTADPFFVSVSWPQPRMVKATNTSIACSSPAGRVTLAVAKRGGDPTDLTGPDLETPASFGEHLGGGSNSYKVKIIGGIGTYIILAGVADFRENGWMDKYYVTTYAKEHLDIHRLDSSGSATMVVRQALLPHSTPSGCECRTGWFYQGHQCVTGCCSGAEFNNQTDAWCYVYDRTCANSAWARC